MKRTGIDNESLILNASIQDNTLMAAYKKLERMGLIPPDAAALILNSDMSVMEIISEDFHMFQDYVSHHHVV